MTYEEAKKQAQQTGGKIVTTARGYQVVPPEVTQRLEAAGVKTQEAAPTTAAKPRGAITWESQYRAPAAAPSTGFQYATPEQEMAYAQGGGYGPYVYPETQAYVEDPLAQWMQGLGGGGAEGIPPYPTEAPPQGYRWIWNEVEGSWVPQPAPQGWGAEEEGISPYQQEQIGLTREQMEQDRWWREQQLGLERGMEPGAASEYQQWQMGYYPQQAQLEAQLQREQMQATQQWQQQQIAMQEKQYGAQLAASPLSWLEYEAYKGQQPAIQPFMLPLMPEQYQGMQAGQAIPGWTAQGGQGMPELLNPSAQYLARMGPTAAQQWMGYKQARTGERPEESMWRAQQAAPPGGGGSSLQRYR